MNASTVSILLSSTAVLTVALAAALMLRGPALRYGGAQLAYRVWLLVPGALFAYGLALWIQTLSPGPSSLPAAQTATEWVQTASQAMALGPNPRNMWVGIWLLGCIGTLALMLHRQRRLARFVGDTQTVAVGLFGVSKQAGPAVKSACRRPLEMSASAGPLVRGLFRPSIVLPSDFRSRYSPAEQELILRHEQTHIDRKDLYVNAFAACVGIVFWFHPLLHWAQTRLRIDQELACDAAVLAHPLTPRQSAATYAQALVKAVAGQSAAQWATVSCH